MLPLCQLLIIPAGRADVITPVFAALWCCGGFTMHVQLRNPTSCRNRLCHSAFLKEIRRSQQPSTLSLIYYFHRCQIRFLLALSVSQYFPYFYCLYSVSANSENTEDVAVTLQYLSLAKILQHAVITAASKKMAVVRSVTAVFFQNLTSMSISYFLITTTQTLTGVL